MLTCFESGQKLFNVWNVLDEVSLGLPGQAQKQAQDPHVCTDASQSSICEPDLIKTIFEYLASSLCSWLKRERGGKGKKTDKEQSTKKCWSRQQPTQDNLVGEKRAARRQHQHWLCSHRSAGNYDNNAFPRQPLSDLVSKHSPFLKSPLDSIWYDYKVKILFKERPLTCL